MKKKINLQLIGISVLAVVVTTLVMFRIFYDVYRDQVRDDLETVAQTLKDTHIFQEGNQTGYYFNADTLRVTWVGADGNVLYDNSADETNMENHAARPEIQDAFRYGSGESVRESETLNRSTYYYALRLDDGSVLRVSQDEENVWSIANNMIPAIAAMMAFMVILCIVLARILTRSIIDPIEEMAVNIDDYSIAPAYKELVPFAQLIRKQHADILGAAKMRQDFTANVSHELKTPLMSISGYAELMMNGMVGPDNVPEFSGRIYHEASRLSSLVADIIQLSRLDEKNNDMPFEAVDLYELAEDIVLHLQTPAMKKKITLSLTGKTVVVRGVRQVLYEMFYNLADNAVKYTEEGGTVEVTVGKEDKRPFYRVEDTGIGIPKEEQKRIFERFYRVDKSHSRQTGGTGLGLSIVKHGAALHHAEIKVESELSKGTKMELVF